MPTTIVTVPCFSGAPWALEQLTPLAGWPLRTMRLPDSLETMDDNVDFVARQVAELERFVLVGDSFGAVVALGLATRRPTGLEALVLSGGFAANPVTNPLLRARIRAARFLPGPLYRQITLRLHAASLASPYDADGDVPWSKHESRALFLDNTPYEAYVKRAKAALDVDYRDELSEVRVPTLIITPSHDELIGAEAAHVMLDGIPDASEVVLDHTGHMFRFSHPTRYATAVRDFVETRLGASTRSEAGS